MPTRKATPAAPSTGTRITSGPHGLAGVCRLASYTTDNFPRNSKLWNSGDQAAEDNGRDRPATPITTDQAKRLSGLSRCVRGSACGPMMSPRAASSQSTEALAGKGPCSSQAAVLSSVFGREQILQELESLVFGRRVGVQACRQRRDDLAEKRLLLFGG